jgi:predicted Fe-S protein YdhL (DUF1289 family)
VFFNRPGAIMVETDSQCRPMQSPCTKICTLDPARNRCLGCARTVDEIARWATMSEAERARIMAELPARLAAAEAGA